MKIETKKFVRKITAVASAALMTVMPISGALAQASLASLSQSFITDGQFDAYVAVGTCGWNTAITCTNSEGMAKDIAGAIEVAAAFAQQAKTLTSSSGTAVLERNVSATYVNSSKLHIYSLYDTPEEFTSATTGYSWMVNTTVQNTSNHDIANVTAKLKVSQVRAEVTGNYSINEGQLIYNLTFDTHVGNGTKNIPFPDGKMYQITNWTASEGRNNITLGALSDLTLNQGQTSEIGSTGVTVSTNRSSGSGATGAVEVEIKTAAGHKLVNTTWDSGSSYSNDTVGVTITLRTLTIYNDGTYDAVFDWTTSNVVLKGNLNEESTQYPGWRIATTNGSNGITSIAWVQKSASATGIEIMPGTQRSLLGGLFSVIAQPFEVNSTDKKESTIVAKSVADGWDISFNDENATTHYVDLSLKQLTFTGLSNTTGGFTWLENIGWTMNCIDDPVGLSGITDNKAVQISRSGSSEGMFNVTNGTPYAINQTSGNLTGWSGYINVTWNTAVVCDNQAVNLTLLNFTSDAGNPLKENLIYLANTTEQWAWSGYQNGTLMLNQSGAAAAGKRVYITWKDGSIDNVQYPDDSGFSNRVTTAGSSEYTPVWGTMVRRDSLSQVALMYPEVARIGKLGVGRVARTNYTLTTGQYNTALDITLASAGGESVAINKIAVGLAKLDTEVTSSTLNKPIVLVGGPSVNQLVKSLADAGKTKTSAQYEMNRAYIDLIADAFNGKTALVIAGYTGDDTRKAAQVVASQVLGTNMGLTGTSAVLNTAGATFNDVTVV